MTTRRRELRQKIRDILEFAVDTDLDEKVDELVDAFLGAEKMPLDWKVAAGLEITQDDLDNERIVIDATNNFEAVLLFSSLPWHTDVEWTRFEKWVVEKWRADSQIFRKFESWRNDAGKFEGLSNAKIRQNPRLLMDCWPKFASTLQTEAPKNDAVDKWDQKFVPAPERK